MNKTSMERSTREFDNLCPHCHMGRCGHSTYLILATTLPKGYDQRLERRECLLCGGRWWELPERIMGGSGAMKQPESVLLDTKLCSPTATALKGLAPARQKGEVW